MRSGFVALVGRPGAGKSSLLNRLVGRRVAITSATPRTTRLLQQGILTLGEAQIVFVDTPAVHEPRRRLDERMMAATRRAVAESDVVVAVFDASAPLSGQDRLTAALVRQAGKPAVAVLNKADRRPDADLSALEARVRALAAFAAVVPASALRGEGVAALLEAVLPLLPEGPQFFPPEMITDQSEPLRVRELIREQVMALTREELPHGVAVEIEEFASRPEGPTYIRATLHVERDSHRKMLIGKGGRMLKAIGTRARAEVEHLLGRRVFLDLWVKTSRDWRRRDELIRRFYPEQP